jgi:TetR/AcrR family transcriptional regulator, cholesterol catabolism regulator
MVVSVLEQSAEKCFAERLGRRERKKLEVLNRIREAALELFREKGYEATRVEEIAERADVAKGTFFNYFPRKDALLRSLAEDVVDELLEELGPPESWEGTAHQQLLTLFLQVARLVARDPELSKVMLVENVRNFWMEAEGDPLEREFRALQRAVIARGRDRGEIAADADVGVAARLVDAAYVTTMVEWLKSGAPEEAFRTELRARFEIIFRGLAPAGPLPKGREA